MSKRNRPPKPRPFVFLVSLGCSKNLVESEIFLGQLQAYGIGLAEDPDRADALVVNTCGFLQSAADESFEVIREMAELRGSGPKKGLYVFGCLVGRDRERMERELDGVDGFFGVAEMKAVARTIAERHGGALPQAPGEDEFAMRGGNVPPRVIATLPHTAYLRIADGCNCKCTFCTIPSFRGRLASRDIEGLVQEAADLAASGVRELSIIAQDSTQYGQDLYGEMCLERLLGELDQVDGLDWYRIMYAFPAHVTDRFIDFIGASADGAKSSKMCPYLDMPVQHADSGILRRMGRGINEEKQRQLIERIRQARPDIHLRTTLLIGFPGETEAAFDRLLQFVEDIRFDHVGVFTFSAEPGTPSYAMADQVPAEVMQERFDRLIEVVDRIGAERAASLVETEREVLIDDASDIYPDFWRGRHAGQAPDVDGFTYVRRDAETGPGDLVRCRILASEGYDLFAERVG